MFFKGQPPFLLSTGSLRYPQDTLRYPRDSLRYPPDTLRYPRDTLRYPRDTLRYPQDTLRYPRDTLRYPRDTLRYVVPLLAMTEKQDDTTMPVEINQLVRSKRRTLALFVESDGSLIVRAPLRISRKNDP